MLCVAPMRWELPLGFMLQLVPDNVLCLALRQCGDPVNNLLIAVNLTIDMLVDICWVIIMLRDETNCTQERCIVLALNLSSCGESSKDIGN